MFGPREASDHGCAAGYRVAVLVHVPAHPRHAARPDIVEYEVRRTADGDLVLPVFTTRKQLVRMLGPAQPWVAQPLENLERALAAAPTVRVVVDPATSQDLWTWDPASLRAAMERAGIPAERGVETAGAR